MVVPTPEPEAGGGCGGGPLPGALPLLLLQHDAVVEKAGTGEVASRVGEVVAGAGEVAVAIVVVEESRQPPSPRSPPSSSPPPFPFSRSGDGSSGEGRRG